MSGMWDVGEDTIAWASWPPPQIYVFEIIRNQLYVQQELRQYKSNYNSFLT